MIPRRKDFIIPAIFLTLFLGAMSRSQSQESLREWFNKLKSPAGELCCHNFDGISLDDQQWRTQGNRYQVLVEDKWLDVPATAVVQGPNRLGRAHLWLRYDGSVRCFIPGVMI